MNKIIIYLLLICFGIASKAQELPIAAIKKQITSYKNDIRGPYYRIKWFCKDGTIREPKDPCPDSIGGGIQHASYKDDIVELGKKHHLFFGEILAYTDKESFWDSKNNQNRLKQYQMGKYLASVDNGWILRKGQFYRGAIQSEDEQAWGVDFYSWILKDNDQLKKKYFLLKQSLYDIPHDGDNNSAQLMRSQSKIIADEFPDFMDVRIKIHGKPDKTDIQLVKKFKQKYSSKLSLELKKEFTKLSNTLQEFYAPTNSNVLLKQVQQIRGEHPLKSKLISFLNTNNDLDSKTSTIAIPNILFDIRKQIATIGNSNNRLIVLDLSNELENIFLRSIQEWKPLNLGDLLEKIHVLSLASAGAGLIEIWEWEAIKNSFTNHLEKETLTIFEVNEFLRNVRSIVEWSSATVKANYQNVTDTYTSFEPKSYGFIDDRIRSSVALSLGESVSELGRFIAEKSAMTNQVMELNNQSSIRGLNPGYACGTLRVISGSPENVEVDTDDIYVFQKPPSDLKPVAGIMTVSEGNLVSHVQLLARNLGIPNAALSAENLSELLKYNGQTVFYAVSKKGNVILKTEDRMTLEEKNLFSKKERNNNKIAVPVNQIRLDLKKVLNIADVDAKDSGKLCGPKAANLGQLKAMFPEQVVGGLVIPFGIFKDHMDQKMPDTEFTYWQFLNTTFDTATKMMKAGADEKSIEKFQLEELAKLRAAVKKMPLKKAFLSQLKNSFITIFRAPIGQVPVFLRSDTNMEDLKEFTGAGLNLTLFNILEEEKIITGIKDVWASPYTERSFKWRQQYLLNPENVFPSILIIPSVDVDYSGVLITKGINLGTDDDLTIAFSRGAGGAVDGQSAETRLITSDSTSVLLAPARQPDFIRLPKNGGVSNNTSTFETPILNPKNIKDIHTIAKRIRAIMPNNDYKGAYDVELGFQNDKLWLFQIRPFVENNNAKSSSYLSSITPKIDYTKKIKKTSKL
mgnify:CR=1 FL=1